MNYELLNYLKSSIGRQWLRYYADELSSNREEKQAYVSQRLYEQTKVKIDLIFAASTHGSARIAVLIVENNPLEFIAAFLAGVITEVNIFLGNSDWQQQEWRQVLNLVTPDLIFGDETVKSKIGQLKSTRQSLSNPSERKQFEARSHIMIPTGGTSGKIKFAIHTWETLSASAMGFESFFDCPKINSVCTLPLYHVSGLMQLMRSLLTKGKLIICSYKSATKKLVNEDKSIYFISLVPTQLQYLLDNYPDWLKQFKTVLVGGAAPRRSLLNTARECNIAIALTYGMTETASGVVALKPADFLMGNGSNGRVLPHAEISIDYQSANNIEVEAPKDHKIGAIAINSTSLYLGYYPQLLTAARSFITDDLGFFDAWGYLHLIGRSSHKIITGGENVFPAEVESAIYATDLVKDVCVVGVPNRQWGEAVTAIYSLNNSSDLDLVKQQLRGRLAKYKQPKYWLEVNNIPRNNRGKIDSQQLKAIANKAIKKNILYIDLK